LGQASSVDSKAKREGSSMAIRDDGVSGPLIVQSLTSAKSKSLSLRNKNMKTTYSKKIKCHMFPYQKNQQLEQYKMIVNSSI